MPPIPATGSVPATPPATPTGAGPAPVVTRPPTPVVEIPRPAASTRLQAAVGLGRVNASTTDIRTTQQYFFHMGYLTAAQVTGQMNARDANDPTVVAIKAFQTDMINLFRTSNGAQGINPALFTPAGAADGIISANGATFNNMKRALSAGFRNPNAVAVPEQTPPPPPPGSQTGDPATAPVRAPSASSGPIIEQIQRRLVEMGYLSTDYITGVIETNDGQAVPSDVTIMALRELADNTGISLGENIMPNQTNLTSLDTLAATNHRNPEPAWTTANVVGRPFAYYESSESFLTGIGVRTTQLFGVDHPLFELGGVAEGVSEIGDGDVANGVGHFVQGIIQTPLAVPAVLLEMADRSLEYLKLRSPSGIRFLISAVQFFVGVALFFANVLNFVGQVAGALVHALLWALLILPELGIKALIDAFKSDDAAVAQTPEQQAEAARAQRLQEINTEIAALRAKINNGITDAERARLRELQMRRANLELGLPEDEGITATAPAVAEVPAPTETPATATPPAAIRTPTGARRSPRPAAARSPN